MAIESEISVAAGEYGAQLASLVEVITALATSESVDDICRYGVELGRDRLGFDRLGVWFYAAGEGCFRGSFGTDADGNTRDERECRAPANGDGPVSGGMPERLRDVLNVVLAQARDQRRPVVVFDKGVACSWRTGKVIGKVSAVYAVMRDQGEIIGFLGSDNLFSGRSYDERRVHLLTVYASSMGHLIARQRAVDALRRKGEEQETLVAERTRELARAVKELRAEVAERKRVERALRVSERRFSSIWSEANDGMRLTDGTGEILAVNRAFCRMVELSERELLGRPLTVYFRPDGNARKALAIYRQRFVEGDFESHYERTIRIWNGEVRHFDVTSALVEGAGDGDGALCLTVFRDVTDRRNAEEALRESENRFRLVWENSFDGMRLTDEEGTVMAVNPAFCRLVGLDQEELVGRPFTAIYAAPQKNAVRMREYRRQFSDSSKSGRLEGRMGLRSGRVIEAEVTFSVIGEEAGGRRLLSVFRDITERKRAEEQRLDLERRMLDTQKQEGLTILAGGIAHDFNNLLTGILGNANLGMRQLPPASTVRPYLENIEESSLQAAELCKKMLAYAGQESVELHEVDLNEVIGHLHQLVRVSVDAAITLQLELGENLPLVNAEASQIEQMVMNLVINAAEAIGNGAGRIAISTGVTSVGRGDLKELAFASELKPGEAVYFEISDNGSGMKPETLGRAFDPFFSTKFTGRGLGLSLVQGIVNMYNGGCRVTSAPGRGTTVRILLPAFAAAEKPAVDRRDAPAEKKDAAGTILVVDDEEGIRKIARGMLEAIGWTVVTADGGGEGIRVCRERPGAFAAVLLDLAMPDMGGPEVLRELRALDPKLPVLLMSGYARTEAAGRLKGDAPDGFLQKPFSLDTLREAVQSVLAG